MNENENEDKARFELVNTRDGSHAHFPSQRAALEKAEARRIRSYQLWELGRDGARVLRFEAST